MSSSSASPGLPPLPPRRRRKLIYKFKHDYLWNPDIGTVSYSPDRSHLLFSIEDIHPDCYGQTVYLFQCGPVPVVYKLIEVSDSDPPKPVRVQWSMNKDQFVFEVTDCGVKREFECVFPPGPKPVVVPPMQVRFQNKGHHGMVFIEEL